MRRPACWWALLPALCCTVLHRALYTRLITHYFGVVWRVPFGLLAVLCLFVAGAAALAVHGPVKRLQAMPVTAAINEL